MAEVGPLVAPRQLRSVPWGEHGRQVNKNKRKDNTKNGKSIWGARALQERAKVSFESHGAPFLQQKRPDEVQRGVPQQSECLLFATNDFGSWSGTGQAT
jgi:hypothetical protein